jgi:hypothetical protein
VATLAQSGAGSVSDPALWTAQQQHWLQALGHAVWIRGALPETETAAQVEMPAPALVPARREFQPKPTPANRPPPVSFADNDASPIIIAPRRAAARLPDRLHIALIRAAGINPNAPDMAEVIAQLPASAQLRGNPAAKRALWPRLRALRKQTRQ